ncbi:outer membrane beta-barrel protein [Mucilaginibacter aquariorum]|uniref:Outer membrane beta-barrel protein n=1 Tax=Mucilaginibacter aquariorum TaxID=2967225 RepID=A0ABT1T2S5_9SPHI|nr:outer membrane beta-barrel protein [Mucilaginibacter aquariorum]MCQ6958864.1 outer membrane beta-barrel protein [Mucilaginibacter aquariorum]
MDEQFDNKLTNHIREVFDNYEHPGAEHGWEQLRKKFPAEKKHNKVAWLWWSSAAALILVFLSIALWYNNQDKPANNIALKPAVKQQPVIKDTSAINSTSPISKQQPVIAQSNKSASSKPYVSPYLPSIGIAPTAKNATGISGENPVPVVVQQPTVIATQPPAIAQAKQPATVTAVPAVIDSQKVINNIANQPQLANTNQPAANSTVQPAVTGSVNSMVKQRPAKTMDAMFAEDKLRQTAKNNSADKQADKKVNFSVYAATYFNYAEGSTNQINAGAGITSDFRISRKLKLSTGVALAQNTLNYNTAAPSAANSMMAAAPALKQEALFATTAVLPVFKNYNANLVGLDIPINIKYEFNPQKNDTYISAGLSSGTFIDENYTYNYTYSNGASSTSNAQDQQTSHNSFNNFYFAKMLNLSFGVGYPVGGNRLIVEPFVKYPLGGLGAQDIRFGAGGVNLKFSFKTKKK